MEQAADFLKSVDILNKNFLKKLHAFDELVKTLDLRGSKGRQLNSLSQLTQ